MSASLEADTALQQALQELLALAGLPESPTLTTPIIQEAIHKLKTKLSSSAVVNASDSSDTITSEASSSHHNAYAKAHENVMVVGQLGHVLHQVKHLLTPMGCNITLAKNMEGAIISYQQTFPSLIVMDVLMPTSREGLGLIQVLRQLAQKGNVDPTPLFVVLSSVNQEEHLLETCHNQGIKYVLDRQDGWQQSVLDIFNGIA